MAPTDHTFKALVPKLNGIIKSLWSLLKSYSSNISNRKINTIFMESCTHLWEMCKKAPETLQLEKQNKTEVHQSFGKLWCNYLVIIFGLHSSLTILI